MKVQELTLNTFLISIEPGDFTRSSNRNYIHRMNYGGNRNWSDKDYEDREARIDKILEMNPGL